MRIDSRKALRMAALLASCLALPVAVHAQTSGGNTGGTSGAGQTGGNAGAGNTAGSQGVAGQAERQATPGLEAGINDNNPNQGPNQRSVPSGYGGWNQNPWFFNPDVRNQLRLSDDQVERLRDIYTRSWDQYQQGLSGLQNDLTDEQRLLRQRELGQNFQNGFTGSVDQFMSDPVQRQRFGQLMLQYQGFNAFTDPSVQQRLNLTDRQREQLARLQEEWNEQMQGLSADYPRERNARERFLELRQQAGERIGNVLTEEQRRIWMEMLGQPFDFPPDVYFPSDANTRNRRNR